MHELAAVGALVETVVDSIAAHQPCRVEALRVQRGSAFSEDALLQGFLMLSQGTPLEGANLDIDVVDHIIDCPCGIEQPILAEQLVGHIWICPNCAHVEEVDEEDDLLLLDVTVTPLEPVGSGWGGA
ncbi:MAG: hydrogenase/urease maturation nickel metallochaperone HypA [Chloroflexota bacterium]